ncbi:gp53-like domain-containing protein [Pseudomonas sp. NPDC089554]|uniref:gp53-like domain-containing protein n=1 Tax=Pseudomonas sp. NPDC089554 TaxID=3390653 RepID=UPI003D025E02
MSRADSLAINDKAVQDFVLEGEINEAEITAGAAQGRKWFSLRRLRMGFTSSFATNGYLILPTWLGGLVLQWGTSAAVASDRRLTVSFPIEFPSSCLIALANYKANTTMVDHCQSYGVANFSKTSFQIENQWVLDGSIGTFAGVWFALGH